MALRVDYVVRETATNLKRNLTLTFATVVTIAIALTLVGASLLMKQGVNRSNVRFRGNVQTIVYMKADAAQDQIDPVEQPYGGGDRVRRQHDVGVEEDQNVTARAIGELVTGVRLAEPTVGQRRSIEDGEADRADLIGGAVGRAVVEHQDLHVGHAPLGSQ